MLTLYVNGVLNPADEAATAWDDQRQYLSNIFPDSECFHLVHNPTMPISAQGTLDKLGKNKGLAVGASILAAGAVAAGLLANSAYMTKMFHKAADTLKLALEDQANIVSEKLASELEDLLQPMVIPEKKRSIIVNIVAHSHGGWVARNFIQNNHASEAIRKHGVEFRFFILGCPVLVSPSPDVKSVKQLHNAGDPLSLYLSEKEDEKKPFVFKATRGVFHSSIDYLEWLEAILSQKEL